MTVLYSGVAIGSFIHSSLFAQKFQYNNTEQKTELDEKVVKH